MVRLWTTQSFRSHLLITPSSPSSSSNNGTNNQPNPSPTLPMINSTELGLGLESNRSSNYSVSFLQNSTEEIEFYEKISNENISHVKLSNDSQYLNHNLSYSDEEKESSGSPDNFTPTDSTPKLGSPNVTLENEIPSIGNATLEGLLAERNASMNGGSQKNDSKPEILGVIAVLDSHRVPKTILYTSVSIICFVALGMLVHLLVFHVYIGYKGLTTYEYLKPPQIPPPSNINKHEGSDRRGSAESEIEDGNANGGNYNNSKSHLRNGNNESVANGSGGRNNTAERIPIEDSEAIWSTMTEIDLNAPEGQTLPRDFINSEAGKENALRIQNEMNSIKSNGENFLQKKYNKNKGQATTNRKPYRGLASLLGRNSSKVDPSELHEDSKT